MCKTNYLIFVSTCRSQYHLYKQGENKIKKKLVIRSLPYNGLLNQLFKCFFIWKACCTVPTNGNMFTFPTLIFSCPNISVLINSFLILILLPDGTMTNFYTTTWVVLTKVYVDYGSNAQEANNTRQLLSRE